MTNIIAYCQQNWYVWVAIYTDWFTLREEFLPEYFIPGVLLKRSDLCFYLLALFEYLLRIKIKKKKKRENEDDLDLFLNGPNFMWNGMIISMLLIKTSFFKSYSPEGISFSSQVWT